MWEGKIFSPMSVSFSDFWLVLHFDEQGMFPALIERKKNTLPSCQERQICDSQQNIRYRWCFLLCSHVWSPNEATGSPVLMSNADCYRIRHNALLGGTTIDWSKVKTRRCSGIGAPRQINILVQHGQPNITIACITASTNPQLRQPKIGATSSYI